MGYDLLGADDILGDDVLGADDLLGDDLVGADMDVLGARRRRRARWRAQLSRGAPGAPAHAEMMMPLGLGAVTFTNLTPTEATLSAPPQLAFRPERLVLVVTRSAGAAAIGVALSDLKIGQRSQLVAAVDLPAEAFGPNAFGVRLALDPATPGIVISARVRVTQAPGAGESVTVIGTLIGRAVG